MFPSNLIFLLNEESHNGGDDEDEGEGDLGGAARDAQRAGVAVDGGEGLAFAHRGVSQAITDAVIAEGAGVGDVGELADGGIALGERERLLRSGVGRLVVVTLAQDGAAGEDVCAGACAVARTVAVVVRDGWVLGVDGNGASNHGDEEDEKSDKRSAHFFFLGGFFFFP